MGSENPRFVYGTLRPGQLAYLQIKSFVEQVEPATIEGFGLWSRDGLPFIAPARGMRVRGELIWPVSGQARELAANARLYEPEKLYSEQTHLVTHGEGLTAKALVFIGRSPERANPEAMIHGEWTAQRDPLFEYGLNELTEEARTLLTSLQRDLGPAESPEFWRTFIPLQGLYLTLWSMVERYTALAYGVGLGPMDRLRQLEGDPAAVVAVRMAAPPRVTVSDSRTPRAMRENVQGKAFDTWYQARSNLTHRGKGTFKDVELIVNSLIGLHDTLRLLLAGQLSVPTFATPDKLLGAALGRPGAL